MTSFIFRDATAADVPNLARLHVETFNETHGVGPGGGPTYALRESQWRQVLASSDRPCFVLVIEGENGELVGFAMGMPYTEPTPPGYDGLLNKIYLLRRYHRLGLGRRLVGHVARRFLDQGISSMLLFGEARNPSNGFYEVLGAEKNFAPNGEFHGSYGWRDLHRLASICPTE